MAGGKDGGVAGGKGGFLVFEYLSQGATREILHFDYKPLTVGRHTTHPIDGNHVGMRWGVDQEDPFLELGIATPLILGDFQRHDGVVAQTLGFPDPAVAAIPEALDQFITVAQTSVRTGHEESRSAHSVPLSMMRTSFQRSGESSSKTNWKKRMPTVRVPGMLSRAAVVKPLRMIARID